MKEKNNKTEKKKKNQSINIKEKFKQILIQTYTKYMYTR